MIKDPCISRTCSTWYTRRLVGDLRACILNITVSITILHNVCTYWLTLKMLGVEVSTGSLEWDIRKRNMHIGALTALFDQGLECGE